MDIPPPTDNVKTGPHDLHIDVLGASFSITAGDDPAYLEEVLAQYRVAVANTQGISGMKDPLKVAILTGFLLCDEINKLRLQVEEEQERISRQRTAEMQADEKRIAELHELNRVVGNILNRIDRVVSVNKT